MFAVGSQNVTQDIVVIDAVWERIHARLDQPLARLEGLVSILFDRELSDEERSMASRSGHEAAVAMGTLNFVPAADQIRAASALLDNPELGPSQAVMIAGLVDEARESVSRGVAALRSSARSGTNLIVVGPVGSTVDELVWLAFGQGLGVTHVLDPKHAENTGVDAVLVVLDAEDSSIIRAWSRTLRQRFPSIPVVGVLSNAAAPQRVAAVEAATTVLDRAAIGPADIVAEVQVAILRHRQPRTLAVFGSGSAWLAERLNRRGIRAHAESNLTELLAKTASGEVRAVVLTPHPANLGTSSLDRFGVLRLIRSDPAMRSTTVAIVDDQPDSTRHHDALRKGADFYVGPDVDLDELAVMIKSTMSRRSEIEPIAASVIGSGVELWDVAAIRIAQMLSAATRSQLGVGVALIRTAPLGQSTSEELDRTIAAQFRSNVVVSRLDRVHLVIAMNDVSGPALINRMSGLYNDADLSAHDGAIACVECPMAGINLDAALEQGEQVLALIDKEIGPPVRGLVDPAASNGRADVLVVDPDPTVGHVLVASLERRGILVDYLSDGLAALDLLTGTTTAPLPRVVLMDLDLRDIDGMQFLRQLGKAGTLEQVKVVVLSPSMNESELRIAFELGIDDFVPKPFSVPLLLRRLTKALDR